MPQLRADYLPFTQRELLNDNRSGCAMSIQEKYPSIRNLRYRVLAAEATIRLPMRAALLLLSSRIKNVVFLQRL